MFGAALGAGMAQQGLTNLSDIWGSGAKKRQTETAESEASQIRLASELPKAEIAARVEAAKAAGLHPLAALGINLSGGTSAIGQSPDRSAVAAGVSAYQSAADRAAGAKVRDAQVRSLEAEARRNEAEATLAEQQVVASSRALATQPGQAPLVAQEPRRLVRSEKGGISTGGTGPTESRFMVRDAWTGEPRSAVMPEAAYGQGVENLGELWQAVLGAPYAADVLYQKYLQTPREWVAEKVFPLVMGDRSQFVNKWKGRK